MASYIGSSSLRRLSALVADEDAIMCSRIHVAHLKKHGFEIHAVENGKLAVDLIRSGQGFDVIFMNCNIHVTNRMR